MNVKNLIATLTVATGLFIGASQAHAQSYSERVFQAEVRKHAAAGQQMAAGAGRAAGRAAVKGASVAAKAATKHAGKAIGTAVGGAVGGGVGAVAGAVIGDQIFNPGTAHAPTHGTAVSK